MKNENTSSRLKKIIAERGLKQIDILRLCEPYCKEFNIKMGRNDISQYVSGKVEPSQWKLTILAKALNVSEVWLMGYDVPINDDNDKDKIITNKIESLSEEQKDIVINLIDNLK